MPFADVNGLKLHYVIKGTGPRVLFIHGIGADVGHPVGILNTVIPEHFEVLAFDPRGLGKSSPALEPFTIADMADDAALLAASLGWERYHVIGISMGGMVAQELALRYPQAVDRMVLGVTNPGGRYPGPAIVDIMDRLPVREMLRLADTRRDRAWMAANPDLVPVIEQQIRVDIDQRNADPARRKGFDDQARAVYTHDTYDRLPGITSPVLAFAGLYDGGNPYAMSQAMAEQIPDARFVLLESGHGTWYPDPAAWNMMLEFLQGKELTPFPLWLNRPE